MADKKVASLRIVKELKELHRHLDPAIATAAASTEDMYHWQASIAGPPGTPYQGGLFTLAIHIPPNYPFKAPSVQFAPRVYHPNVDEQGKICSALLKSWAPTLTIAELLKSLYGLLAEPDLDHPLDMDIARQYRDDRAAFEASVRSLSRKRKNT